MGNIVTIVLGTRPEAIKLAPVICALQQEKHLNCRVCVTGQHRHMLDQVLQLFSITPDVDLNLMTPGQSLAVVTAKALEGLDAEFGHVRPGLILAQGDTTTAFCAALAAFYHRIPLGHVEAGLRTGNLNAPWPEEANRLLTSRLATLHFAPTDWARENLLREGIPSDRVLVTGNTVVDALLQIQQAVSKVEHWEAALRRWGLPETLLSWFAASNRGALPASQNDFRLVLVTGHRRESFGSGFEGICRAIRDIADSQENVGIIYPVHLNPNVQQPVHRLLGGHPRIALVPPVNYECFVWLMEKSWLILTDSGGVQEEAPTLGKPVLVMRDTTERPEGVEVGTSVLVGTEPAKIVREALRLLQNSAEHRRRSQIRNPYGDGFAAARISGACREFLNSGGTGQRCNSEGILPVRTDFSL